MGFCSKKNDLVVKIYLDEGVDPNWVNEESFFKTTALHRAILSSDAYIVELLVKRGADVNAVNGEGQAALGLSKNRRITSFLLEEGGQYGS